METLAALMTACGVFIVGLAVRFALFPLALVAALAIPAVVLLTGARGYEALRRRFLGDTPVDHRLWRRGLAACHRTGGP